SNAHAAGEEAAIDNNCVAVGVAGGWGHEIDSSADKFLGTTEAAGGGVRLKEFAARGAFDEFAVEVGGEDAGCDAVDADAVLGPFVGQAADDAHAAGFAGGVGHDFGEGDEGVEGDDVDDVAALAARVGRLRF